MSYNSTIIKKKKKLLCGCFDFAFSKGRCKQCATIEDTAKRMEKYNESIVESPGVKELIPQLDAMVSKYVRVKYANPDGMVKCFTCNDVKFWKEMQAGHYIKRGNLHLRFDVSRNIRVQCEYCNCHKRGNMAVYSQRLEAEYPGLPDILLEESAIVYKPTRTELQQQIDYYTAEFKKELKKINK